MREFLAFFAGKAIVLGRLVPAFLALAAQHGFVLFSVLLVQLLD